MPKCKHRWVRAIKRSPETKDWKTFDVYKEIKVCANCWEHNNKPLYKNL